MDLTGYLGNVINGVEKTAPDFDGIVYPDAVTFPIPFFGQIDCAQVLTVGVNPSDGEFRGRKWPASINASHLSKRLLGYFNNLEVPPHPWFQTWSSSLAHLGISYKTGVAAHLDLSPRPTIPMGKQDPAAFCSMVKHDLQWFTEILNMLNAPRLILLAGTVTKRFYMNDFLSRNLSAYGWKLHETAQHVGAGHISFHVLEHYQGKTIPAFFCSVSPSARNSSLLVQRVDEQKKYLSGLM